MKARIGERKTKTLSFIGLENGGLACGAAQRPFLDNKLIGSAWRSPKSNKIRIPSKQANLAN